MNFVIYSGGGRRANHQLNKELIRLSGKTCPSITYIPVTHDEDPKYFKQFKKYYSFYGVKKFINFPLDKNHSIEKIKKAFQSDILYFCGGNTFEFLKNLEASGLKKEIKNFSKRGGVISGQSAGIIILTSSINMASIPSVDCDENIVSIKKTKGMNILKTFEFSPHYYYSRKSDNEIKNYSKESGKTILACDDGSGLVIENNKITPVGKVIQFKGMTKKPFKGDLCA